MDQNEYLKKFRLAILFDEFRLRQQPQITTYHNRSDKFHRRQFYKNPKKAQARFDWDSLYFYSSSVEIFLRSFFRYGDVQDIHAIERLQDYTWGLRIRTERIRNHVIREYFEHLLYVAEEMLQELNDQYDDYPVPRETYDYLMYLIDGATKKQASDL